MTFTVSLCATAAEPEVTGVSVQSLRAANSKAARWVQTGNDLMQKTRDTFKHDFSTAEAAFKKALSINESSTDAMVGMAWVRNSEHKFEEGKMWAERALSGDPRCQDAHALLGDYAVELGVYDEAFDHYQAALDIRADLSSYSRAGHLLWLTGDSTKAQVLLEKAIAAGGPFPENIAWSRSELAMVQFHSGALMAAEIQATKAFEVAPQNPRVLTVMGKISAASGQIEKAIGFYKKSIEIMPGHDALAGLYDLYQIKGEKASAREVLAAIMAFHNPKDPLNPPATLAHGDEQSSADFPMFLAKHDLQIDDAVRRAEEVYKTYHHLKVEDTLAWCYYKQGNLEKARCLIERAMKWKTRDASILFHAGMIYQKSGDLPRARQLLSRALDLNPNFDPVESGVAAEALRSMQPVAVSSAN